MTNTSTTGWLIETLCVERKRTNTEPCIVWYVAWFRNISRNTFGNKSRVSGISKRLSLLSAMQDAGYLNFFHHIPRIASHQGLVLLGLAYCTSLNLFNQFTARLDDGYCLVENVFRTFSIQTQRDFARTWIWIYDRILSLLTFKFQDTNIQ